MSDMIFGRSLENGLDRKVGGIEVDNPRALGMR
jgi:hypothetical protein